MVPCFPPSPSDGRTLSFCTTTLRELWKQGFRKAGVVRSDSPEPVGKPEGLWLPGGLEMERCRMSMKEGMDTTLSCRGSIDKSTEVRRLRDALQTQPGSMHGPAASQ